jgi:hypothetical protein
MDGAGCCHAWAGLLPKLDGDGDSQGQPVSGRKGEGAYRFGTGG